MSLAVLTFLCSISLITTQTFEPKMEDIKALSDRLLQNYSKFTIPKLTPGPFNMTVYVSILASGEIDEIEEKISTVMDFYFYWDDESIRWNATENGISELLLGWTDVWKPIIRVVNPHTDEDSRRTDHSQDAVMYRSSGRASFEEMVTTRTTCNLDLTNYPFDIQSCDINMYIVGYTTRWFAVDASVYQGFDISTANHGSWNLLSQHIESSSGFIRIRLQFERRPLFMLVNILLPIIVLALLTPIVFVLPKKSGERVGYAITMLLAVSVYMTIVSDHLPKNSQPMPLVSVLIFIWYILDASIVFVVIVNTKVNTIEDSKTVPYMSRKFVLLTRKLACQGSKKVSGDEPTKESQECVDAENLSGKDDNDKGGELADNANDLVASDKVTWRDLSHAIDKWCFVISYLLKVGLPIIFFSITKAQSSNAL